MCILVVFHETMNETSQVPKAPTEVKLFVVYKVDFRGIFEVHQDVALLRVIVTEDEVVLRKC
jgi:hypothetical protein